MGGGICGVRALIPCIPCSQRLTACLLLTVLGRPEAWEKLWSSVHGECMCKRVGGVGGELSCRWKL